MADTPHPGRDERGTTLVLAIVFVFITATILVAVGGLAANALLNSSNVRVQRTTTEDAATAVNPSRCNMSVTTPCSDPPSLRPPPFFHRPACPRAAPSRRPILRLPAIRCRSIAPQPVNMATPSPQTRVVDFYAVYCPSGTSTSRHLYDRQRHRGAARRGDLRRPTIQGVDGR